MQNADPGTLRQLGTLTCSLFRVHFLFLLYFYTFSLNLGYLCKEKISTGIYLKKQRERPFSCQEILKNDSYPSLCTP